jgi:hypothetical protein
MVSEEEAEEAWRVCRELACTEARAVLGAAWGRGLDRAAVARVLEVRARRLGACDAARKALAALLFSSIPLMVADRRY